MAFQKLSLEVNAAGTLNAPIVITTNLEVGSWQLKDPRVFADECSVGTDAVSQASFLYQALLQDCVFGDKFVREDFVFLSDSMSPVNSLLLHSRIPPWIQ